MGEVMTEIGTAWAAKGKPRPVLSVAGTSQLARQVVAGAPADVFVSADERWMDYVVDREGAAEADVVHFASNRLVLAVRVETENWADVEGLVTTDRFAMAAPDSVPAGTYGREALQSLGWWDAAQPKAVFSENVRVALKWLARGEVGAALVYATDVAVEPAVKAAYTFAQKDHAPIRYLAAPVLRDGAISDGGKAFVNFLTSPDAKAILARAGFISPDGGED